MFAIAAAMDHFSDAVLLNPMVGKPSQNGALRQWHTASLGRLPGLKFMRTLWVCAVSGGPFTYSPTRAGGVLAAFAAHKGEVTAGSMNALASRPLAPVA